MKKLGLLFIIMMAFLMIPFSVFADKASSSSDKVESSEEVEEDSNEENDEEEDKQVKLYFFHGDGCPHCADAEEFFESIEDEYGHLFEIVAYETWYNTDNAELLQKVAEVRNENIGGVPYILIGNKAWAGYASDYDDEIIETIEDEYETEVSERYDIMKLIDFDDTEEVDKEDYSDDIMTLIIILVVVAGIVTAVVFARKKTV